MTSQEEQEEGEEEKQEMNIFLLSKKKKKGAISIQSYSGYNQEDHYIINSKIVEKGIFSTITNKGKKGEKEKKGEKKQ